MTTPRTETATPAPPAFDLYDQGLQADVATLVDRRRVLQLMSFAGVAAFIAACAPGPRRRRPQPRATAASSSTASAATGEACAPVIPEETAGPFPGDGTNGPDVLTESGVVRSDITTSFGASSGTAEGVPLTIRLLIQDEGDGCEPLRRRRGLRVALRPRGPLLAVLAGGRGPELPARRPGRGRRRHRHVHRASSPPPTRAAGRTSTSRSTRRSRRRRTPATRSRPRRSRCPRTSATRCTRPPATSRACRTCSGMSLATDGVFGDDGGVHQLGTMSGTIANGLTVELAVPVNA